ncbi:MAG TPA: hypothetical protein VIM98_11160 [Dyella sp.]|uniref:hypothetical protein n=1 Tax=Dyella sp. TaxID=1869338 RepID=UPI002F9552D9
MASLKDGIYRAEFLRSPDKAYMCAANGAHPYTLIPVRYTLPDGTPAAKGLSRNLTSFTGTGRQSNAQVSDENGIVIFGLAPPSDVNDYVIGFNGVTERLTYKVYKDQWTDPLQTLLLWPSAETILPRGKTFYVSLCHMAHNGMEAWPNDLNHEVPELVWECSNSSVTISERPVDPNLQSAALVRTWAVFIPQTLSLDKNALSITFKPRDPNLSLDAATFWWRVADPSAARQVYITPALDAIPQPVGCDIPVTATLLNENGAPAQGELIQWSWQRNAVKTPPEVLGDGRTDENGQVHAIIHSPNQIVTDTLLASANNARQASCSFYTSTTAGSLPTNAQITAPAPGSELTAGQPHLVTGLYTLAAAESQAGKKLTWSTDPYTTQVAFNPSLQDMRPIAFNIFSTQITAQPRTNATVDLLGVCPNPVAPNGMDVIRLKGITFTAASDDQFLIDTPNDNAQLPIGVSVMAEASFVDKDGNGIRDASVNWSWRDVSPANAAPTITPTQSTTDKDGICRVALFASQDVTATLHATATDSTTKLSYESFVTGLTFNARYGGPGKIVIESTDGDDLLMGVPHEFTATYTLADGSPANGQELTWSAGSAPVTFGQTKTIVRNGQASTTGTIDLTLGDRFEVTVTATSPNPNGNAGNVDKGELPGLVFENKVKLHGIAVSKTLAANPFDGQFHSDQADTIIRAALQLLPDPPAGAKVSLSTSDFGAPVRLYDYNGNELAKESGKYIVATNASGRCDFQIMSPVFSLFTLTATYQDQTLQSGPLLIADIDHAPPADISPLRIHPALRNQVMNIDPASSTFNVFLDMDDADGLIENDTGVALWLNGRIAFSGTGKDLLYDAQTKVYGASIGNAALIPGETNRLVLVFNDTQHHNKRTFNTKPLLFNVTGVPQTKPTEGNLAPPTGLRDRVTAWDCAQGLTLTFTDPAVKASSKVSVYCFLEDSNTGAPVRYNAARVDRKEGETSVTIPQMYLAGYGNGSILRVNYNADGQWSKTATASLDTATAITGLAAHRRRQTARK